MFKLIIGKFTITDSYTGEPDKIAIYLNDGPNADEGGDFSVENFEKAIAEFYTENF